MKLAIFWEDFLHYHVARINALSQVAAENGHEVCAIALRSRSPELTLSGYHDLSAHKITVLSDDLVNAGGNSLLSKQLLLQKLDVECPDVVAIIGYRQRVSRAALGWCRYHRRGAVLLLESQAIDYHRLHVQEWLKKQLANLYDATFVSGRAHSDYASTLGFCPERIFTGYSVVDNHFWQQEATRAQMDPDKWRTHNNVPHKFFLTACRFIPKKNLNGLINTYAAYVSQCRMEPWSLVIVGDGELAPLLYQQVDELNLTNLVHFTGYLSAERMAHIYGLAAAFILASTYAEQWGLVVNEAMAAGLPVLVSQICGCVPDLIIDGETGFQFDPKHPEELTQLLLRVAEGNVDLAQIGHNAQQHIQNYSPQRFAEALWAAAEVAITHAQKRRWPLCPPPSLWP